MPVTFLPEEELYPPDGASLDEVARAFVHAVRETRVVTNETIHRWADAFDRALPTEPAARSRWGAPGP